MMRRTARVVAWLALVVLAAPAAYLLAALLLGVLAVNTDFRPDPAGIPVWVRTNGVHAEFVMPTMR